MAGAPNTLEAEIIEIEKGMWVRTTQYIPVFLDDSLLVPSPIHQPKCRSAPSKSGVPPMQRCTCGGAKVFFETDDRAQVIEIKEVAFCVQTMESAPFWIEKSPIRPTSTPAKTKKPVRTRAKLRQLLPPDYLALETALGNPSLKKSPLKYPRRRRTPKAGELVFVRNEMKKKFSPWRLLALVLEDKKVCALLVDPALKQDTVLSLVWAQQRTVCIETPTGLKPELMLVPCFPLPDGTIDPGWATVY
jgi:hypothetical protein